MQETGLGGIVASLHLRDVDDMAGHRGREDERAVTLFLENAAGILCRVVGAVEVSVDDLIPVVVVLGVDQGALCPGNTSISNLDVESTKVFIDLVDSGFDLEREICQRIRD